ncbi:MAG: TIM44-like domain-containing protein [Bacilli bacterium]|nr:TIM44-like domain-containing protein [Bacilli bacterium]
MDQLVIILLSFLGILLLSLIIFLILFLSKPDSKFGKKKVPEIDKIILMNIFDIYKTIQYAWASFDIVPLKEYLTIPIYQYYIQQLDILKRSNQQNIISDIELIEILKIYFRPIENNQERIIVSLKTKEYNYVNDTNTGKVVRGSNTTKIINKYRLTLTRKKPSNVTVVCPNCGKTTEYSSKGECIHCNTYILGQEYHFIIEKIEKI